MIERVIKTLGGRKFIGFAILVLTVIGLELSGISLSESVLIFLGSLYAAYSGANIVNKKVANSSGIRTNIKSTVPSQKASNDSVTLTSQQLKEGTEALESIVDRVDVLEDTAVKHSNLIKNLQSIISQILPSNKS